jgi:branched-chain amino acid transport system ATP-binding protein
MAAATERKTADALLAVDGLVKRFGGLLATDNVSLGIREGEIHAIIGPNGAGKTTLIAQLAGEMLPNAGTIRFAGSDVTGLAVDARARLGIARSYQITQIFKGFTALDNVAMAVQAQDGHSFRAWAPARADDTLRSPAAAILDRVGLGARSHVRAVNLAHGEQRQLEIAMALATRPRLLLLDEPMAGMGKDESERMTALLAKLKGEETILLIEHDMDVVFALADRISVLVYGRVIATGRPDEIRANAAVRAAYLGDGDA